MSANACTRSMPGLNRIRQVAPTAQERAPITLGRVPRALVIAIQTTWLYEFENLLQLLVNEFLRLLQPEASSPQSMVTVTVMGYTSAPTARTLMRKMKVNLGKPVTAQCGKRPAYLLLAGNDTVPISVWRGGSMCSTECRL